MNNWTCRFGYGTTYDNIENEGNNNFFNPYKGEGGWEPYQCKVEGLTVGETYRVSFNFTSDGWTSWDNDRWAALPVFVTNNWDFPQNDYYPTSVGGEILGFTTLPKTAQNNAPHSFTFVADAPETTLAVNFGVVDDAPQYLFHFDNIKIESVPILEEYDSSIFEIDETDNHTYSPLAYIESTGAIRENPFTLPYIPVTATQLQTAFNVYDTSDGWCGIFSARNTFAGTGISLYMNGNKQNFGYFTGETTGGGDNFAPFSVNTDYEVTADVTKLVVNGTEYPTGQTETIPTSRALSLFANPEWDNPMRGRINYMTIKEGDNIIYDFKPVMRNDGAFGYYDTNSKLFVQPLQNYNGYKYVLSEDGSYIIFPNENRTLFVGFTAKYEPTVQNMATPSFTWTSSNENVATVAADGTVTGVARGTTIITATDANSNWTASYELKVEPAVVAADNIEVWDGTNDAIVGSIKWSGEQYKPAYTMTFDSGMGYNDSYYNHIYGVPAADENGNAWYETDFQMINVPDAVWSYNNNILPNGWSGNMGEVYVRRYFKAEGELPAQLYMPAPHDDAPCEYYINGTLVWSRTGYEPGVDGWYEGEVVKLTAEQRALIKTDGSVNVFAYHVHQNWGGRYADGGIYGNSMAENSPSKAFEGNENRKRLSSALAQAEGVEGIDADVLAYAKNANVCLQDAGRALSLIRWELRKALSPRHNYTFASAEPADGLECWLYNVGAGQFLAGGNDWGTHTSLDYNISSWPMVLRANSSGENRFSIQTNLPNGRRGANDGLGHNGYVDCGFGDDFTTGENWAWTFEAVGNGNYRIIQSGLEGVEGKYLGMTEDERYQVDTDKAGADNLYNQWKVVTREQLDALAAAATPENPADVSYFIHQNTFSQNDFDGNDKGAANGDLNDSKWDRNAGSIWNWKGNDANGDYVFEMWNTAEVGKVYLKQTIEGLPAGKYIVECTGYYRDGDWDSAIAGNVSQLAYIYAGSEENKTLLPSIMEGANKGAGYGRLDSDQVIPDACAQAPRFFRLGTYTVQAPVVNVGAAGTLEIGIYRDAEDVKEKDWIVVDNFRLYRVGAAEATETVTIGEALYATYVAPVDVDFTGTEVSAFAAQAMDGYVHLEPVTTVPAGTAVVVKADAAGTYNVNTTTGASLGATNELIAATADVTADGTQYILAKQDDEVGFAKATTGSTIAAGKGYLQFTTAVKAFYPFAGNDATGISGIEAINGDAPIYNVAGQRLGKMQKGINIVGGKKVLK
ncbi:MAG: Ig-like domain-containing protein [Bacteroidaceae bacterium]|nr:Ig-like domain-containing protein [Bacteroidaceae bacterium]